MDSVSRSSVTPNRSRLARTIAKVLHLRAATGIAPVDGTHKSQSQEFQKGSYPEIAVQKAKFQEKVQKSKSGEIGIQKVKSKENGDEKLKSQEIGIQKVQVDRSANKVRVTLSQSFEKNSEKLQEKAALEALLAKLFASVSLVKAAYAELQYAQAPYDPEGIRAADHTVVDELKNLSELKKCFLNKQLDPSPETTVALALIEEQKSVIKTYEIMGKKLESQVRLKDSEVIFHGEKLDEAKKQNKLLEKRVYQSGQIYVPENLHLAGLSPSHFITVLRHTVKSIRCFVRVMMDEMITAGWDIRAATHSIDGGEVVYWKEDHKCFAFEHFVCREMFDGFQDPNFSLPNELLPEKKKQQQQLFFERFTELKPWKAKEYLFRNPKSAFAKFCRVKFLRLVHPKMETSFSGYLNQRNLVNAGEFPNTNFFSVFADMAKRVWLLHLLAFSFDPEAAIFQVSKGCRFSEVYMESVAEEAFQSAATEPLVGFTVVPGFKLGKTIIQCQVYLTSQLKSSPRKLRLNSMR